MAFPTSPSYGDTHELGGKTYRFGGVYWSAVNLANQEPGSGAHAFQRAVDPGKWIETLVAAPTLPLDARHGGALLTYI